MADKQFEELLKDSRKADREDKEKAEALARLVQNADWKIYVAMLDKKQQMFADQLLVPSGSLDGCVAQEWVKGALSGLIMARDLPSVTIAAAKELLKPKDEDDA